MRPPVPGGRRRAGRGSDVDGAGVVLPGAQGREVGVEARGERPVGLLAGERVLAEATEVAPDPLVADERPRLPLVGPVLGLEAVALVEVPDGCGPVTRAPEVVRQLEVGRARGLLRR